MKYNSITKELSSIIMLQNQRQKLSHNAGGKIYIGACPQALTAQLAIIDADTPGGACKIKAGIPTPLDVSTKEYFPSIWEEMILNAQASLNDSGTLALIASAQESADFKLLLDRVLGKENFVNQIIWHYSLPGSAKRHFLKRHSVIYIYSKTRKYFINTLAVGRKRNQNGRVHLKKQTDGDGRSFYQITSRNKTLKYYADAIIPFDDVWDIPQIGPRSAENENYPGQKPRELADRLILCLSKPNDTVIDYTCAGGTALVSACENGRSFIGLARTHTDAHISFMRLLRAGCPRLEMHGTALPTKEVVSLNTLERPDCLEIYLDGYGRLSGCSPFKQNGLEGVDVWAVGHFRDNTFVSDNFALRDKRGTSPDRCLKTKETDGAVYIADIYGREKIIALE